jgi:cytochrome P450
MLRVYEELSAGRGPSFPHLDRCIKESLRLLPPVVYFARSNVEPFSLGAHHLSRGTLVIGSHYVTHRLPNLYPDPERFLPDRWLGADPGPYGYIPFGGGARMCVGAAFSQLIFETCLGQILRRFRLAVAPGARIDRKCSLTLGPRWGIPVTVHRPDRQYACTPITGDIHELVALPTATPRSAAA